MRTTEWEPAWFVSLGLHFCYLGCSQPYPIPWEHCPTDALACTLLKMSRQRGQGLAFQAELSLAILPKHIHTTFNRSPPPSVPTASLAPAVSADPPSVTPPAKTTVAQSPISSLLSPPQRAPKDPPASPPAQPAARWSPTGQPPQLIRAGGAKLAAALQAHADRRQSYKGPPPW